MESHIECINPILPVRVMADSLRYYTECLGFKKASWVDEDSTFAMVSRDGFNIYLSSVSEMTEVIAAGSRPVGMVWIGVNDARELHADFCSKGVAVTLPPTNYPWACEMSLKDVDGNLLRFGSAPD